MATENIIVAMVQAGGDRHVFNCYFCNLFILIFIHIFFRSATNKFGF